MCTNAYSRVRVCATMRRRNAAKLFAPASPAETGRRRLEGHQLVGRNADGRAVGIDVRVQVDEAGRDELAAGVEHAQRALGRDIGLERLHHAVADADVAPAAQPLARVEHLAALDDEVELVVRTHRGMDRPSRNSPVLRRQVGEQCDGSPMKSRRETLAAYGSSSGGATDGPRSHLPAGVCRCQGIGPRAEGRRLSTKSSAKFPAEPRRHDPRSGDTQAALKAFDHFIMANRGVNLTEAMAQSAEALPGLLALSA